MNKEELADLAAQLQVVADNLATEHQEIATQTELLQQVKANLGGKTAGGGGSDDGSYDEGYTAGQQAEYDQFWDVYQQNGNRRDYECAFAGVAWNDTTFKPKYDIRPISGTRLFGRTGITDLAGILNTLGVKLDLSQMVTCIYLTENYPKLTTLPELNVTSMQDLSLFIYRAADLVSIEKIILKSDGSQKFGATSFGYLNALVEVIFEGVIGQNGFDIRQSVKLSKASLTSIINARSTTTSGLTVTVSLTAVNKALETASGANNGSTSAEWLALVNTRSNWTITLS